ncbi:linear amide C-N hydrolase [Rickettsiales bacterium LUAb2]
MCTGIMLKALNNDVVRARTMEWSPFDLSSKIVIFPKNHKFEKQEHGEYKTNDWQGKLGFIGLNFKDRTDFCFDGLNEKGLSMGLFYHPDTAEYDKSINYQQVQAVSTSQIVCFILSQCANIKETKALLKSTHITPIIEEYVNDTANAHYIITDNTGECIVIEFIKGELIITDNPLGVITNAPSFDWHLTNLRNYLKLTSTPAKPLVIAGMEIKPLSAGTQFLGMPGDYTSPSRFIRAVAFSQTARKTTDGYDTIQEAFRILDNFNVGVGGGEGASLGYFKEAKSTTVWTIAADCNNLRYYYHTQYNRRTRFIDLKTIDFNHKELKMINMDQHKQDDLEQVTIS